MDEIKYSFKQHGQLAIREIKPNYNITFHNNGTQIGAMDFNGPAMVFTGDAEESAKVFIDWIARSFAARLEEERKAEREACAKVCETGIDYEHPTVKGHIMENFGHSRLLAAAIRARGNT
jgi:hypothetical protein